MKGCNTLLALPVQILEMVLVDYLVEHDVCRFNEVCKTFHEMDKDFIWRGVAELKYGRSLAHSSKSCYEEKGRDQWLDMLKDDNLRGAMPALDSDSSPAGLWKSLRKLQDGTGFQCCLVSRVCLDRSKKQVLVYFEARGLPGAKSISYPLLSCLITELQGRVKKYGSQATKFINFLKKKQGEPEKDRYQGALVFPMREFLKHPAGKFYFCYAGSSVHNGNFEPIELFEIEKEENNHHNFCASFSKLKDCKYASKELHPYMNDGEEVVKTRWESHMPPPK